ncbi:prolyl-tRNA synthetase associated domain-containing protein [Clostridiaceae bacterium HSG29]|nr:prolyl-tRNA synthetase associated domain-containing protein [Clostridiaceae bacterium HSG29]
MDILNYLESLNIEYEIFEHVEVYTVNEAKGISTNIPGAHCKNLFLRNRKGNEHYLVVLLEDKEIKLKDLSKEINSTSLSFASSKRLKKHLNLEPGSVGPFGLINDIENDVNVIIDKEILEYEKATFHPNRNTATVSLLSSDLIKFIEKQGYNIIYI